MEQVFTKSLVEILDKIEINNDDDNNSEMFGTLFNDNQITQEIRVISEEIISNTSIEKIKEKTKEFFSKLFNTLNISKIAQVSGKNIQNIQQIVNLAHTKLINQFKKKLGTKVTNKIINLGLKAKERVQEKKLNSCHDE